MKTVLVIGEDHAPHSQLAAWLGARGWFLIDAKDSRQAMELARQHAPEIVLCDVLTPQADGFQFCRQIHGQKDANGSPIIIAVGNGQAAERVNALKAGADEYLVKPILPNALDRFLERFGTAPRRGQSDVVAANGASHAQGGVRIKFWGVRGSIPSPGPETVFYGGNTSCVEVRVGSDIIVLDAGSGLRRLGLALVEEFKERPMQLNLLITHTHWDHIQGFPFFLPAYDPKNNVTIYGFEGASQGLQSTLSSQMESPYFPISLQQMPGHIAIRELHHRDFYVNEVAVRAQLLNHPGSCTGYRLMTPGGSISYLPDIELYKRLRDRWSADSGRGPARETEIPPEDSGLVEFIRDSDVLIIDSQYDAAEYEKHVGWGHSCVEDSVAFALEANVKHLFLFHHDPDHTDEQISRMVARARQMASHHRPNLIVEAARESCELILASKARSGA